MDVGSHYDMGRRAYEEGRWPDAAFHFEIALRDSPGNALLLAQLGNALKRAGQFEKAVQTHEALVRLVPSAPEALSDLAATYLAWGRLTEAEDYFVKALALRPDDPEINFNLGTTRQWLGRLEESVEIYRRVVNLAPDHDRAWSNLAICLKGLGMLDEARAAGERAVALDPKSPDHQWNLALIALLFGEFESGFKRYEWRRRIRGFPTIGGREWAGEPLDGEALVVYTEQGMGDTLQFIRYLPAARKRAGEVVLMCRPTLVRLLKEGLSGIDDIRAHERIDEITPTVPLLSLPHLLGNTSPLREAVPYLRAAPERVRYWSNLLAPDHRLRVGVCWQGNPGHRDDASRSIPLTILAPLFHNREARFFSLQKFDGIEQLAALPPGFDIMDLGSALDIRDAFVDTAAVMTCLDVIVTVDTAIAHLAGALGCETWTLLPFVPDFRWGLGPSLYYPTMRLFRQRVRGDWSSVIAELESALLDATHPTRCLI